MSLFVTLSTNDIQQNYTHHNSIEYCSAECRDYLNVMLSDVMLNVIMLSVVSPSAIGGAIWLA